MKKNSANDIQSMKGGRSINMLTCYDKQMAAILNQLDLLDLILVGDSLGEVLYGDPGTQLVSLEMMERHVQAVRRGAPDKHIVGDMPIFADKTVELALFSAKRLLASGADSVKIENASTEVLKSLVKNDIPVFGHVGLTPQSAASYRKHGKTDEEAKQILVDAKRHQDCGCFALVAEAIPETLCREISESLDIPLIAIACGKAGDGQVRVSQDVLGFDDKNRPYVEKKMQFSELARTALAELLKEF